LPQQSTRHHLENWNKISATLLVCQTLDDLTAAVRDSIEALLNIDQMGLYLRRFDGEGMQLLLASDFSEEERREAERTAMDRHPGEVIRTGKTLHIPDVSADGAQKSRDSSGRSFKVRARLWLPVQGHSEVVGALGLFSLRPGGFSSEHIDTLRFLANVTGIVFERIASEYARSQFFDNLNRLTIRLAEVDSLDELAETIERFLEEGIDVEYSGLYFFDFDTRILRLFAAAGFSEEERRAAELTALDRHPGAVIRSGEMIHVQDVDGDVDQRTKSSKRSFHVRSRLFLPIHVRSKVIGTLGLASSSTNVFNNEHVMTLQVFANLAGMVYERLNSDITRRKMETELTQLIDTANAPIFGVDVDGKINEWNQMVARITGYGKDEVEGKNLVETYITDEYKVSVKKVIDNALEGTETDNYEVPLYTKDGQRIMVLLNATTRRDVEGNIVGVVGVGQDITELSQHRENLEGLIASRTDELNKSLASTEQSRDKIDGIL